MAEADEPASPSARLMQTPSFNLCILGVYGFKTTIDVNAFTKGLHETLVKHPRFSSLLAMNGDKKPGNLMWKRTRVDLENHVFAPDLDPDMDSPDKFVEQYTSDLAKSPMDRKKPLWELHILNVKTSEANSTAIFKIHHSMGDGVSLISLLQACADKPSDPESLPDVRREKRKPAGADRRGVVTSFLFLAWSICLTIVNTLVDCTLLLATLMFLKDTKTPIKVGRGADVAPKRFVHRTLDLDEVKLVKTAMNVSINDVLLGVTQAGLSRYLNTRYEKQRRDINGAKSVRKWTNFLPRNISLRSAVVFNLRPSATIEDLAEMMEKQKGLNGMWGNFLGIVLLPLSIALQDDPLTYIRRAKATMDRKKLSLEAKCAYLVMKLMILLFGSKVAASVSRSIFRNTTLTFSNVVGPPREISLFGHPVSYIAPTVYGFPQALVIHYQSYADKLTIVVGADEKLIPNPHQLCDDLLKSLENMKEAVMRRGLVNESHFC